MLKFAKPSYNATSFDEGGPARRLCAAAVPIIETIEGRMMMSVSPVDTLVDAQVTTAASKSASTAKQAQNPSGTSVWVNPSDSAKSLVISTSIKGGLNVYDLNGNTVQHVTTGTYTDVDVRNNVMLAGKRVSLVAADNSTAGTVDLFAIDPNSRELSQVGSIKATATGKVDGLTMYHSADTGNTYVFVSTTTGAVEQIQLFGSSAAVTGKSVRTINVGSAADSLVADDATGSLYVSQNGVAIWKYGAEAADGSVRIEIDSTHGHMGDSPESLALYADTDGSGYLIAARNDTNDYAVYDRKSGDYVTKFSVDSDHASAGSAIAAAGGAINNKLPGGMFVVRDDSTGSENLKIVSWTDIASSQSSPLGVNTSKVAKKTSTYKSTDTQVNVAIDSLDLYKANSNSKLQSLSNGAVIDLAKLGTSLNVRANTDVTAVGSVVFTVNGKTHTENTASYDLAGTAGTWTPSIGTYTITATAYGSSHGHGVQGTTQTITITVVDSRKASTGSGTSTGSTSTSSSSTSTGNKSTGTTSTSGSTSTSNTSGSSSSTRTATSTTTSSSSPIVVVSTTQSGKPSADNTGPADGTAFTNVAGFTAKSNTTYTNLHITGEVVMTGLTNVTLINCVIDGNGAYFGVRADGVTNCTIQNCEIKNCNNCGIYGDGYKAIGNFIHQMTGDGFKAGNNCLIQGNYVTDLGWNSPDAHADGVQSGGGGNITIVGNFFDMPNGQSNTRSNSSLFLQNDVHDVTFSGNWCVGGNYTVHAYSDSGQNSTIKVTNNVFVSGSCQYGFGQVGDGVVWTGNVTDSGAVATAGMK